MSEISAYLFWCEKLHTALLSLKQDSLLIFFGNLLLELLSQQLKLGAILNGQLLLTVSLLLDLRGQGSPKKGNI